MRIFTAIRHASDPKQFYSGLWSSNFYPALRRLGHELIESQTDLTTASSFMGIAADFTPEESEVRARTTQAIVDEVRSAHEKEPIDLFLSYFYNAHFDPAGFGDIRGLGIPTINFYCNSIYQFDLVAAIAPAVDFAWHAEMHAAPLYRAVGANPVWVQMGADPDVYRPHPEIHRTDDACFVGQRYADRETLLTALDREEIPFKLYGRGWDGQEPPMETARLGRKVVRPASMTAYVREARRIVHRHGLIDGTRNVIMRALGRATASADRGMLARHFAGIAGDVAETFARHAVVLNFSNVWQDGTGSTLISHVRLRDFEGPMARTCYLTGYTDEIESFYRIGHEIDCYRSTEELVAKTRFYIDNPAAADRLREAGWQRATQDHSWERRFSQLFRACNLS